MSESPLHIALLVCDHLIPPVVAIAGDYHAVFTTLLTNSCVDSSNPSNSFILHSYDVVDKKEYPSDNAHYDAIIVSGSKATAYEHVDWIDKLTAYVAHIAVLKPSTKIIGICFGHQIVSRALGGDCVSNDGKWEVGITPVQLTDLGQRVFGVPVMNLQQSHRDHVPFVPPDFHLLGSTAIAPVQGMVKFMSSSSSIMSDGSKLENPTITLTDIHILTVQGHPEFTRPISEAIISARLAAGVLDPATAKDAERRAGWRNDGASVFGRTMFRILGITA